MIKWFRLSLSSDGSRVAIGARENDGNGAAAGHVRIYDYDVSSWVKVGVDIDGEALWIRVAIGSLSILVMDQKWQLGYNKSGSL